MARNSGDPKAKCDCGVVEVGDEWYGSIFFTEEMLKNLPIKRCPWCSLVKTPQKHHILFELAD